MADVVLSPVLSELVRVLAEQTTRGWWPSTVPADAGPSAPYGVCHQLGGRWDDGLAQGNEAVSYGLQLDAVGRSHVDALALLDVARTVLLHHRPIAGDGWWLQNSMSDGPPTLGESDRLVYCYVERYTLYVTSA